MDKIVTPLSFKNRRAPFVGKVVHDADVMYDNARYVIVLDKAGNVLEQRPNRRFDDEVVDCLAVFAPCIYKGVELERVLVLEIGFRRFVPYAQAEHRLGAPTLRGPVVRFRKGEERKPRAKIKRGKKRSFNITTRVPIAKLTNDALFDIMPALGRGIQECVDSIVLNWTNPQRVRWVKAGTKAKPIWKKHEMEHSISVRIPKEADLLCATATFAELRWRLEPKTHIKASADAIMVMLKYLLIPGRRKGRDARGDFSSDFVRESAPCGYVAHRLREKIDRGYTSVMVKGLLDFIGPPGSMARRLVEKIWRVYKIPQPKRDKLLQGYQSKYGEMEDLLLERWLLRDYRSLRLEKKKRLWVESRTYTKPYHPHASNSHAFVVLASKEAQDKMVEACCDKHASSNQADTSPPIQTTTPVSHIPDVEDDDIPWDTPGVQSTGTDNECPF